jgi:TM2 domain-containing membrane protein YozV
MGEMKNPSRIIMSAGKGRGHFIMLGVSLGLFGIHNFYAGYYGKGALQLLITITWGMIYIGIVITGIWVLIDLLTVRHDADGGLMT